MTDLGLTLRQTSKPASITPNIHMRLNKVIKELNVSIQRVADTLKDHGIDGEITLNTKITEEQYETLKKTFADDINRKEEAEKRFHNRREDKRAAKESDAAPAVGDGQDEAKDAPAPKAETSSAPAEPSVQEAPAAQEVAAAEADNNAEGGLKVVGHIDLDAFKKPAKKTKEKVAKAEPKAEPKAKVEKKETAAEAPKAEPAPQEAPAAEVKAAEPAAPVENAQKETAAEVAPAEAASALGAENGDGVFKLNSEPRLTGPKVLGTVDLSAINGSTRPKKKTKEERKKERDGKKRNRIGNERVDVSAEAKKNNNGQGGHNGKGGQNNGHPGQNQQNRNQQQGGGKGGKKGKKGNNAPVTPPSDEDVAKQVKETLARLQAKGANKGKGAKYRREKRDAARERHEEDMMRRDAESRVLKLTEFVTANELATMMDVPVTQVIGTCMSIGIMVSINQRLDQETIEMVAEEFGFTTEFVSAEVQEAIVEEVDNEEDLLQRAPIVTVMGHVDHGKTSLLDHIRNANVIAGEAGGITQHIGAYNVKLKNGREITFLDTPGHEAFTAMRARGAQVTDIAIIIIAADDNVMPQTKEAINHAVAAGVPIVFAINKIDKPGANPDAIKTTLASMNFLVEEWGGKYQSQDISAKSGLGIYELLEKVLLEADLLDLKANPNRRAVGTVIESSLDKGRGYVSTVLVSNGTLRQGDILVAGTHNGRVKALFNERGVRVEEVAPAHAATVLGFNGAPQAGDQFNVMETEQEAREIANKRLQLQREQNLRTSKMLTLDEIGRRLKLGDYQELNIVVKGDVDGSVQALSDSFIKLSTESIAINVIHKGVGQISENDVTLAAASKAVIVGFQVRPSAGARKLAEKEGVDIRLYSIIYDAIEEVKEAMEGMLKPIVKEEITAMVEVRQVFHISKVGYIAGAYVVDGKVSRSNKARLIRDGVVVFTGDIAALKRFKDDVKEVTTNFECGISLQGCNDIKEGDMIETYQEVEIKQKLNN
ncbi:translation initiation factor IF-2 [Alloprevotella sp. oral taxon 473 str. F0040]|nr:translation initiation factor IF-2 [Alloprevotella sp. oral taxon 473 str. F0040]